MTKKLVSLVCPVYNEEKAVNTHYSSLCKIIDALPQYDFEFIYTDNCSTDKTVELLTEIAHSDSRVKVFKFSRNFGYQNSILTGYRSASGDVAINFDADLQDPPEMLPEMLKKWEMGYKITYGIREKRQEMFLITFCRKIFYKIMSSISDTNLPPDVGDFMLIDRVILDLLKSTQETCLYLRGMIFSYGFPQIGIPYSRNKREVGTSNFSFSQMLSLALDGIVNQSAKPLQYIFYSGILAFIIICILLVLVLLTKIFNIFPYPLGTASIILFILLSIAINTLSLGVLGIYIARIYIELKNRPISIIEKEIFFDKNDKES